MADEEWGELLKLRDKAGLSAKTGHRFKRLEDFISYTNYLNTYTQDEKDRLLDDFKELSESEKQALLDRAAYKTSPNLFHLTDTEIETLEEARKRLPFHDRARLLCNLILTAAGTAWLDLGEVFDATIEVDDKSSRERQTRPYAHISFRHVSRVRVETIDIIESVKKDPAAIAHPAIAFAIYNWQRVIYTRRVIEREDITSRSAWGRAFNEEFGGGRDVRSAERNLKAISETLYAAAEKRAIPIESALALKMQECGLLGPDERDTVVFKAWDTLKGKFIRDAVTAEEVLRKVEPILLAHDGETNSSHWRIPVSLVMDFLKDSGDRGGRRFVWINAEGNIPRRKWVAFRNAFAAWFFDLGQSTIQEYLERAAKQNVFFDKVYEPSMVYPTTTVERILRYLLTNPLVAVREPVWVRESDVGYHCLEDAIKTATSETE